MKFAALKTTSLALLTALTFSLTHAEESKDENIEVTPNQTVTQQELAAIYVLSEICPKLVDNKDGFEQGYSKLAQEHLPEEKDAVSALMKLSKSKSFKPILAEAESDAKSAGDDKNKEICQELTTYSN
ncbi:MCR_0457 family protein [Acinetobacter sp. NigerLNRRAM0016]